MTESDPIAVLANAAGIAVYLKMTICVYPGAAIFPSFNRSERGTDTAKEMAGALARERM